MRNNTKELENNLKQQGLPSDLHDKVKEVVTYYWDVFFEDVLFRPTRGF